MPIYEFRCDSCGHEFERFQRMRDPDPDACPSCQGVAVDRLISISSFQLKGSGWYVTDYTSSSGPSSDAKKNRRKTTTDSQEAASKGADNHEKKTAKGSESRAAA